MKKPIKKLRTKSAIGCLAALSLIFAYAVVQSGGIIKAEWEHCTIGVGLLLLVYFRLTTSSEPVKPMEWWLWCPALLLLAFVGFQLIPIPAAWLEVLSPMRAKLLESVNSISPRSAYASISVFPTGSLSELLRFGTYFVVFVLTREFALRLRSWVVIMPVVIVAAVEAGLGLLQYDPLVGSYAQGTYANQNHFAGLLELSLPFAALYPIAAFEKRRGKSFREAAISALCIAAGAVILVGIILTMSRMAFVAALASLFVAGTLVLSARGGSRQRSLLAFVVLMILGASAFVYLAPDTLIGRFSQAIGTDGVPGDVRIHLWSDARRLSADFPLVGSGLGTFSQAFVRYKTLDPQIAVDAVHNDYLQLLIELGAVGFAIAAVSMACLLLAGFRAVYRSKDSDTRYAAIACLSALAAIIIHSFTDLNLYIPANGMVVAWFGGVIASFTLRKRVPADSMQNS